MKYVKIKSAKSLPGEIWADIDNYNGVYMVSNAGRVKRLVGKHCLVERILKPNKLHDKRHRVTLSKEDIKEFCMISRLVASAFIPNPNNLPVVCHKDDDPENNNVDNLWWGTQADNIKDCHKKGRASNNLPKLSGDSHPMFGKEVSYSVKKKMSDTKKRITDDQILSAKRMYESGESLNKSAILNGISVSYLSQLLNGGYKRL